MVLVVRLTEMFVIVGSVILRFHCISDLNILVTTGISVVNNGSTRLFKGALLAFLADNLASNDLGGFKKSFSFSFRVCRTCLVTTNSLSRGTLSSDFELRSLESHLKHIENLDGPTGSHYSKTYGINRKSALLDIMIVCLILAFLMTLCMTYWKV